MTTMIVLIVLGGLFLRFLDEIVQLNPHSPFVVLAVASSLGQILGIARGSVGLFTFNAMLTIAGSLLCIVLLGKLVESVNPLGGFVPEYEEAEETL